GGSRFLLGAWLALAPVLQAVITIGNRRLAKQDPAMHYPRIMAAHEPILEPLERRDARAGVAILAQPFPAARAQGLPAPPARGPAVPEGLLAGQTVILTGAAGGIGRHVAHALVEEGAAVAATDIAPDGLPELGAAVAEAFDAADPDRFDAFHARVRDELGAVDG